MNSLLIGSSVLWFGAATYLTLAKKSNEQFQFILVVVNLLAILGTCLFLYENASQPHLGSWALIAMFIIIIGTTSLELPKNEPKWNAIRTLLSGAGCLAIVAEPTAFGAIVASFIGIVALSVSLFNNQKSIARVFLLQSLFGYLLIIIGFALVESWIAGTCLGVGLFLITGILPFHAGLLDLYTSTNRWQFFPFVIAPLQWFLALRIVEVMPSQLVTIMRIILFVTIVIGSISSLRCDRSVFLCVSRSVLLSWAILFLTSVPSSISTAILSFSAYLTASAGLHSVYRLAETRIGPHLVSIGGLAKKLPGLAGFGLFFAMAVAGLPLTVNFFVSKSIGTIAANHGVDFVFISYFAVAILGIAAYRNHTLTFLGRMTDAVPAGLDIKIGERLGLITIAAMSTGTTLLLFFAK